MFVTRRDIKTGKSTTLDRVNVIGTAVRNGSSTDIQYVRNGKVEWIGVDTRDLYDALRDLLKHGDETAVRLTFDEIPAEMRE
jgi:hypothetical protein